ncbi:unnamed protein product [Effrenium voratum]|uniref:Lon N-terminal domain-containing protein n=1 Tax=Effrenium voratum TaxID=2562239 RepID=A0AA36ID86_9DINO|nr:unnamed protein product [Effrenium voratum]
MVEPQNSEELQRGEQDAQGRYLLEGPSRKDAFALLVECVRQGGFISAPDMARRVQELDLEARIEACRFVDYYLLPGRSKMQLTKELFGSLVGSEVFPREVLDLECLGLCRSEMIMERIQLSNLHIKNLRLENSHVKRIEVTSCFLLDCDFSVTVTSSEVTISNSRLENVQLGVFAMITSVKESCQLLRCNLRVVEELFVSESELDSCTFRGSDEDRKDRQFISAVFQQSELHGALWQRGWAVTDAPGSSKKRGLVTLAQKLTSQPPAHHSGDAAATVRCQVVWVSLSACASRARSRFRRAPRTRRHGMEWEAVEWLDLEDGSGVHAGGTELPLMPLPAVYLPSPSQQLMVSEKRYLKLYDDILLNGSRMFVVSHSQGSKVARMGLAFKLKDLKDVSADTHGHFKYAAEHEVPCRVRILSVLNAEAGSSKDQYLRAEVELLEDEDPEASLPALHRIRGKLQDALAMQGQEQQDPELGNLARKLRLASVLRSPGFWAGSPDLCSMLASIQGFRLQLSVRKMREHVKRLTEQWAAENPEGLEALKVDPEVLPTSIRAQGKRAQELMSEGAQELQCTFQRILQARELTQRAALLESAVGEELQRMRTLQSLNSILGQRDADITFPFDKAVCEQTYFHGRLLRMTKGGASISLKRARLRTLPRIDSEGKINLSLEDCDILESLTFQNMRLQLRGLHFRKPCDFLEVEFPDQICDIDFPRGCKFYNVRFKEGLQACVTNGCRFEYCNLGYGQDAVADCLMTQCHFQACRFPFLEDNSPVANIAGSNFIACRIQWSGPFAHEESFVINSHWLRKWNLAGCTVSDTAIG